MVKAYQVAERMKLKHPFKNGKAGKSWFTNFEARNESLSIRKPQKLCTSRRRMMTQDVVKSYFDDLGKILTKEGIKDTPTRIWNMDESGFHLEHTPSSIVARKGTSNVPGRVSPNRENITVVACINAAGVSMPPMFIVKGKTPKSLFAFSPDEGPSNSIWTWQAKAWMEDVLAVKWFREIFLK